MELTEDQRKVLEIVGEEDEKNSQKIASLRSRIEAKKNQVYRLVFDFDEADPENGKYGPVKFRLFRMSDVAYLTAQPAFQREANVVKTKPDGSVELNPMNEQERKALFELHCEMLARVLVKESAITKEELVALDDFRFVEAVYGEISERSGLGSRAQKDIQEFFRHPGR